jgi:hypothetical protein
VCSHTSSWSSSSIHQQSVVCRSAKYQASAHTLPRPTSLQARITSDMACDELIAQCGAWATLPAPSYDYLLSGPFHSSNTTDRSSDLNTAPLASSRDGQTDVDRVSYPTSRASTTALSGDKATTHSTETQSLHAGAELSMDHGSVLSSDTSSMSLFIQANVDTPDRDFIRATSHRCELGVPGNGDARSGIRRQYFCDVACYGGRRTPAQ